MAGLSLIVLSLMLGCGDKGESDFVRDPVTKVKGRLLIDGKAEPMVTVQLNRVGGPDEKAGTSKLLTVSGFTDPEGNFNIGTYDRGPDADGAPDGEYTVTFLWGQIGLMSGRYEGDKFEGKYADPEKSKWPVTVAGAPVDMGTIELSTTK